MISKKQPPITATKTNDEKPLLETGNSFTNHGGFQPFVFTGQKLTKQTTGYSTPKGQVGHQKCTEENFQDHQQECNYQVVLKSIPHFLLTPRFFSERLSAECLKKLKTKRGNMSSPVNYRCYLHV